MTMNNQETVPATARPLSKFDQCLGRTVRKGQLITPLARAALDNGVPFADVQAYVESVCPGTEGRARDLCNSAWHEAVNVPEVTVFNDSPLAAHVTGMVTDTLLEGALVRSVLAVGSVEHARLWWGGVL